MQQAKNTDVKVQPCLFASVQDAAGNDTKDLPFMPSRCTEISQDAMKVAKQ